MAENGNIEYLVSRYLLKQLLNKGLITQDEFSRIDAENKKSLQNSLAFLNGLGV